MVSFVDRLATLVDEITRIKTTERSHSETTHQLTKELADMTKDNSALRQKIYELQAGEVHTVQIRALRQANSKLI